MRIPMSRLGWKAVVDTYKARNKVSKVYPAYKGNKRCFVYVNFKGFLKGYSLFVPMMTAGLHDAKRFFMFPWDYK